MKKLVLGGVVVCGLAAAGWYIFGSGSDLSGTYVGKNDRQAFLVQIVQPGGGKLSGFLEEADLTPGGQVEQANAVLGGTRDGKTFTVTLIPSGFAKLVIQPGGLSGSYNGKHLSLVGLGGDFSRDQSLQKSDAGAQTYKGYVGELNRQAQAIQVQKAEEARRAALEIQKAGAQGLTPRQIQTFVDNGQEVLAVQALNGVLAAHPDSGTAWYLMAEAQDAQGNESEAHAVLAKADQYAPGLLFADAAKASALRAHIDAALACCSAAQ